MFGILAFIILISVLIFVHELGHYLAAKWAGVRVEEFGLGYPPTAAKVFHWRGTDFTLNWIPFGGFVRLAGEELTAQEKRALQKKGAVKGEFFAATPLQKMVIIMAGIVVNLVFGIVIFIGLFSYLGIPQPLATARVGTVMSDSPAAQAGMPAGVEIVGIATSDGEEHAIGSSEQAVAVITQYQGQEAILSVVGPCEGFVCQDTAAQYEVYFRTPEEIPAGQGSLGIAFEPVIFTHYPWWQMPAQATWHGLQQTVFLTTQIIAALGVLGQDVASGQMPEGLAGPVGIVHQAHTAGILSEGLVALLSLTAMLSINLAVMNALPIPPLDGGRAVFIALSALFSEKKLDHIEYYANYSGYVLLLGLIILVTAQDIGRLF